MVLGADRGQGALEIIGLVLAGLALWTLSEYWLHRKLFHWDPDHPIGHRIHFIIHGVHHDHPNDKMRLVMPPGASIPLAALFFGAFWLVFGLPTAYPLFAGFLIGYLVYDYTHYYLHHFVPQVGPRQAASRAAHAPPLPGPPLRVRSLDARSGTACSAPCRAQRRQLNELSGSVSHCYSLSRGNRYR